MEETEKINQRLEENKDSEMEEKMRVISGRMPMC